MGFFGGRTEETEAEASGCECAVAEIKTIAVAFETKIMELLPFCNILPQKTLINIKLPEVSPVSGCYC
jgi:hypothetical protein